tara:strand:+ start:353 stop:796 length:444 start_codon:yes stop_codon:yes gene_type:complete
MSSKTIYQLINQVVFFNPFTEEEKKYISSLNNTVFLYHLGEAIFREGEEDAALFILLKGTVSVNRSETVTICTLKPGSVFGEMSLLGKRPRSTSIIADEEAIVLKIDRKGLENLPGKLECKFKDQFIKVLINRLDEMNKNMEKLVRY